MKNLLVIKRYATALFEVALERSELEGVQRGLASFVAAKAKAPLLGEAIGNEEMPLARRCVIVCAVCDVLEINRLVRNFLTLLVRNERINLVEDIASFCGKLMAAAGEVILARVVVAGEEGSDNICSRVQKVLEEKLGRPTRCVLETDPHVIGGFIVKVGECVIDASVRGRLDRLKNALLV